MNTASHPDTNFSFRHCIIVALTETPHARSMSISVEICATSSITHLPCRTSRCAFISFDLSSLASVVPVLALQLMSRTFCSFELVSALSSDRRLWALTYAMASACCPLASQRAKRPGPRSLRRYLEQSPPGSRTGRSSPMPTLSDLSSLVVSRTHLGRSVCPPP